MTFDLGENAFALLATTPRANRAQIDDAYHDALLALDGHEDEARLNRAQQSLISPRDRLDNEISFFVDTKPSTIHKILVAIREGDAADFVDSLTGLDRANLLAHLCYSGNFNSRRTSASKLVETHKEIQPATVHEAIIAARSISGFGTVQISSVVAGIKRLRQLHAKTIVRALCSDEVGRDDIAKLAGELKDSSPSKRAIIEAVLAEYESEVIPELEVAAARVRHALEEIIKHPEDSQLLAPFSGELTSWDRIAQPLQIADQARGIDEHNSRQLFESIREACLELANERKLYKPALFLSQLACEVFSELPDAARKLSNDVTQLSELADWSDKDGRLSPLVNAVQQAEGDHQSTSKALRKSGFQTQAKSPVAEIFSSFVAILHSGNDMELNGMAALVIRQLAISLCNESNNSEAGLTIISGLLTQRALLPEDVVLSLQKDQQTLQNNLDFSAMTQAVKERDLNKAQELVSRLLETADKETQKNLLQIQQSIDSQITKRKWKIIGWGVIAVIVALMIVFDKSDNSVSDDPNGSSYEMMEDPGATEFSAEAAPEEAAVVDADQNAADVAANAVADVSSSNEEIPPARYQPNQAVSLTGLRYCRKQQLRIEAVEKAVTSQNQVSRFNEAVNDYNARCGSIRYLPSDMVVVDREIASERSTLRSEGEQIIGSP